MKRLKLLSVVGARPNFVKIAPFCRELEKAKDKIEHLLVHTGQHYDVQMSSDFFETLSIPKPDVHLEVGSASHTQQTANIMMKFEPICIQEKPDWVILVGDVNSTLACSLVAAKLGIKVAHIEAGLRSFDMSMPEEINRRVTDAVTDIFFTPSLDGDENLINEGVAVGKIKRVGNIMIDTLVAELQRIEECRPYSEWGLGEKEFVYLTLHRPSNVDERETLAAIMDVLLKLAEKTPIIFPVHPRTLSRIEEFNLRDILLNAPRLHITEPVSYHNSLSLAKNALLVLTDSGGLQEETTYFGTPCLTLRPNTERPITITSGTNKLTTLSDLRADIDDVIFKNRGDSAKSPPPLWDGKTASRIVETFSEIALLSVT